MTFRKLCLKAEPARLCFGKDYLCLLNQHFIIFKLSLGHTGRTFVTRLQFFEWNWTRYFDFSLFQGWLLVNTILSSFKDFVNICTVWYRLVPRKCVPSPWPWLTFKSRPGFNEPDNIRVNFSEISHQIPFLFNRVLKMTKVFSVK